jgi:hypothetical protein
MCTTLLSHYQKMGNSMAKTKRAPLTPKASKAKKVGKDLIAAKAPDAKPARGQHGSKTQITLSISPKLLERLDEVAQRNYLSRAALLTVWINKCLEQEA